MNTAKSREVEEFPRTKVNGDARIILGDMQGQKELGVISSRT